MTKPIKRPPREANAFPDEFSCGIDLRDYFAARAEPLDARCCQEGVEALAGYPRPHDQKFRQAENLQLTKADITPEEWIDYFRWWADANAAHAFLRAEAMLKRSGS